MNINYSYTIAFVFILMSLQSNAQQKLFSYYGNVEPSQRSFAKQENPELFQEFLSSIGVHCRKNSCSIRLGGFNEQTQQELDSTYWKYAFVLPGFKVFPAFMLKCRNGYMAGIYSTYNGYRVTIYNLDLISYDKKGNILEKTSFPIHQHGFFPTQDSCFIAYQICGGLLYVENGVITYEFESSRCCTPEMEKGELYADDVKTVIREKRKYVYKITDDACLIPVAVSNIENNNL